MKYWRELLLGFLLGAVVILTFIEYTRRRQTLPVQSSDTLSVESPVQAYPVAEQETYHQQPFTAEINRSRQNAITNAIERVAPAVVGINVTQMREYRSVNPFWNDPLFRDFFPSPTYQKEVKNLGSGFIISPDGYVLTNEHVVHNATQILITTTAHGQHAAHLVGSDYYSDIALLKIDAANLPFLSLGNSDSIITGEWVMALGNPFGLFANNDQPSVTVGVVSALNRDFNRTPEGRVYKDMIQTDASINRGNSGGPLVNSLGEVIGMATMIFTEGGGGSLGIGFAIPINRIKQITDELRARGEVNRNYWTGLSIQNLDRLTAMAMNLAGTDGVLVSDVEPNSPAETAGIQVGDVILAINKQPTRNYNAIRSYLENEDLRVGSTLKFSITRDSRQLELPLKLAEMPR